MLFDFLGVGEGDELRAGDEEKLYAAVERTVGASVVVYQGT